MNSTFPEFDELEATTDDPQLIAAMIGDTLQESPSENITRIYCQNLNGLSWDKEGGKWPYVCDVIAGINADIACFTEINTDTNKFHIRRKMETVANRHLNQSRLITATSKHQTSTTYKPGGTAIMACGAITSTIKSHSRDRMGRWTSMRLTTSTPRHIRIIVAYQVCQNPRPGTNTAAAQQRAQIIEEQATTTNATRISPRASFISDMQAFIHQCQENGDDIILLGDFNEEINAASSGMERLASACGLADLFSIRLGNPTTPPTYQRGTKRIDYILMTPRLLNYVAAAGYDPFGYRIPSDHRGFFVDLHTEALFNQEIVPLAPAERRDFSSKAPGVIQKYVTAKMAYLTDHRFFERLEILEELTQPDPILAEALDRDFQRAAAHAGKQCKRRQTVPWSPQLASSWAELHFYRTLKAAKATDKNYDLTIKKLQDQWEHLPRQLPTSDENIRTGYNTAMRNLREARQIAQSLREEFLSQKAALYASLEQQGKAKVLERLIRAESQHKVYQKIQYIRNQDTSTAGLSSLKVPRDTAVQDPNQIKQLPDTPDHWTTITVPHEIEQLLLERNKNHFGQSEGTPFTMAPLKADIGYKADGYAADLILEGQLTYEPLDEATKLLIKHLQAKSLQTLSGNVTTAEIREKLKRWDEKTSTSPSGIHLGHYHCMWRRPNITDELQLQKIIDVQEELLRATSVLLNYALKFGHTYQRWTKVVNVMLQKDPGNPRVHRLRVIHLYEADYNLLLAIKWRQATYHAEDNRLLNEGLYGSRPGRSAHDPAFLEVLHHETYRMSMKSGINFDLDATSCYDRILPSIAALSSRRMGMDKAVTLMNTSMLEEARYHLKTSLGISNQWYQHSDMQPIYGTGQGSGNSPAIWCFVCSTLFDAFESIAHGARFTSYDMTKTMALYMVGFVDDCAQRVNQFQLPNQPSPDTLIRTMQRDAQAWNDLLWASGGALEQSKCSFHLIQSSWTPDGHPFLTGGKSGPAITLMHNGHATLTYQKSNYESHKTLGCHISPAKCNTTTFHVIQQKNQEFAALLETNFFTRQEARTFYTSIYLPSMTYSLPITPLQRNQCNQLDTRFLRALIPRCGYNRNMSNAIRYAPYELGGAGFKQLYVEQGALMIQQVFKFLNHEQSQVGQMLYITLSWTQAFLGVSKPILEDVNQSLPPSGPSILLDLRTFLREINGKLIVQQSYTTPPLRLNDKHIMDVALSQNRWNRRQLIQINSCRRYLQAQSLADITSPLGNRILSNVYNGRDPPDPQTIRIAHFNQRRPETMAWRTWRRFLLTISTQNGVLREPLKDWIATHDSLRHWPKHVYNPSCDQLYSHIHNGLYQPHSRRMKGIFEIHPEGPTQPVTGYPVYTFHTNGTLRMIMNFQIRRPSNPVPQTLFPGIIPNLQIWESQLLHMHQLHVEISVIQRRLREGNAIICSDGSASSTSGTYGYIVSTKQGQRLARGKGVAPGAYPNSFRSEAYGVLSALRFILRLLPSGNQIPNVVLDHLLDNQSVITRTQKTQQAKYVTPNQKLQSEQDVIDEIVHTLHTLPIKVELKWIKGHQDSRTNYANLSLPAQLNCDADREAADLELIRQSHPTVVPPLPQTPCQLIIQGKSITSKIKRKVHLAAQGPKMLRYLTEKFAWDHTVIDLIDWETFSEIIKQYRDKWNTIVKHIHDISPTGKIAHRNNELLPHECPACGEPFEDNVHVIICNHQSRRQWRTLTLNKIRRFQQDNRADPFLMDILHDGLSRFHNQLDSIQLRHYPVKYHALIRTQNSIGWDQLYRGRWCQHWAVLHTDYIQSPQDSPSMTGRTWVRSLGRLLIDRWLILWSLRNEQRHGADQQNQSRIHKERVTEELTALYSQKDRVCPSDRHIFYENIQMHVQQHPSTAALEDWINTHKTAIKASADQAARLGIQRNRPIHEYPMFNPSFHGTG